MNPIVAGNPAVIEQGFDYSIGLGGSGPEAIRTWAGTPAAVKAKFNELKLSSIATHVHAVQQPGSALAMVQARFSVIPGGFGSSGVEPIQESTSLRWNEISPELHRNPAFINITSTRIKALEDEIAKAGGGTAPTDATELSYYKLRLLGIQTYRCKVPVVTYTRTAMRGTAEQIDAGDSGKIVSLVEVPAASFFNVSSVNLGFDTDTVGIMTAGWLFHADGGYLGNGNTELVETYEYGVWPNALYDFV